MDIYARNIHNYMIKPYYNSVLESVVNSATGKVMISDATLRSFIAPKFHKMNPRLRQIIRCDICIILKDMQIDFNRFRTNLVKYLRK